MMNATIQKWGNSQAIRLPKALLEIASLEENEQVQILARQNEIIIKKAEKNIKHKSLAERLKDWDGTPYELTDEDREWQDMRPAGREIW